jgi:hypothetical protein
MTPGVNGATVTPLALGTDDAAVFSALVLALAPFSAWFHGPRKLLA